jgi:hypothetical protein
MTANKRARKRRRINGDGSVYRRTDGYWAGAFYARTTAGRRKRVVVYGKTLQEARDKLLKAMQQARAGIPVPDQAWRLDLYLEYRLENVVKRNRHPTTYNLQPLRDDHWYLSDTGSRQLQADQPVRAGRSGFPEPAP